MAGKKSEPEAHALEALKLAGKLGDTIELERARQRSFSALFRRSDEKAFSIERFTILERVGAGGMGTVYAAYDPKLDRKVALKLVRCASGSDPAEYVAEGKTLARVVHPNVVTIHDVGIWRDYVYLVMEFVRGQTLRELQRECQGEPSKILDAYRQAALGLAAIHDAGVVHRDFKPENAMLGDDLRVRVLDFGLAGQVLEGSAPDAENEAKLAGTPGYIAPELYAGKPVSAASDQYAFCVALREALSDWQPDLSSPSLGPEEGGPSSRVAGVSAQLQSVWDRGMQTEPEKRFSDMRALCEALTLVSRPRRKRRKLIALGLGAMSLLGLGIWLVPQDPEPCTHLQNTLENHWPKRDRARTWMALGHHAPNARFIVAQTERIEAKLSRYVEAWANRSVSACQSHADGVLSDRMYDRKVACLDDARHAWDELSSLVKQIEPRHAQRLALAVQALPDLQACSNLSRLIDGPEAPPQELEKDVDRARSVLAKLAVLVAAKQLDQASSMIERLELQARKLAFPPLLIDTLIYKGRVRIDQREPQDALGPLAEATQVALTHRLYRRSIHAWARWAYAAGVLKDAALEPERAAPWFESLAKGLTHTDFERGLLANNLGCVSLAQGARARAKDWFEQALPLVPKVRGAKAAELVNVYGNLALIVEDAEKREQLFQAAIRRMTEMLGPGHPVTLRTRATLASVTMDSELADRRFEEACTQFERLHPKLQADRADCVYHRAISLLAAGEHDKAGAQMRRVQCKTCSSWGKIANAFVRTEQGEDQNALDALDELIRELSQAKEIPWWRRAKIAEAQMAKHWIYIDRDERASARALQGELVKELATLVDAHPSPMFIRLHRRYAGMERLQVRR